MIRKILFGMALVAGLASCNGDYDDWKSPQHNEGSDPIDEVVLTVQPTLSQIDFATETATSVQLFTTNYDGLDYKVTIYSADEENDVTAEIAADEDGYVSTEELQAAIEAVFGSGEESYDVKYKVATTINVETEDGTVSVYKEESPFSLTALFALGDGAKYDSDPILYLTGSKYNWGNPWVPLAQVNGYDGLSWIIIYLHAGEEFKFAPQAGWSDDFGMAGGATTIIDDAGMNPSGDNNIIVGNAGWYLITVNNPPTGGTRSIRFSKPDVYLIGETSPTGWNIGADGLFTIPTTETGKFVSPAFVKDAEVRMCVSLKDPDGNSIDWWRTEFVVIDGEINYRCNSGDQTRVAVKGGKKCYLDFTKGLGSYK